jgi:tryptophan-rich sensory protein
MMAANGLSNYVIFRARDLWRSFLVGSLAPICDAALFVCLIQLDAIAARALVPYLIYRVYGVWWGYALWKLNQSV